MTDRERPGADPKRADPILRPYSPSEPILRPPERRPILAPEAPARAPAPAPPRPAAPRRRPEPAPARRAAAPILSDEEPAVVARAELVERAARVVLCAGILLVPLVFDPRTIEIFNLAKLTLLWTAVLAAASLTAAAALLGAPVSLRGSRTAAVALVLVAVTGAATALSINRTVSLYGLYHRYGGFLSLVLYAGAAGLVIVLYSHRAGALMEIGAALVASAGVVGVYVILQRANVDPFHWLSATGTTPAHPIGTMGNPDMAGAFLAIALPFAVYLGATVRRVQGRALAAAGGLVALVALVLTRSGVGLAAAAAGLLALVVFASAAGRLVKVAFVAVVLAAAAAAPAVAHAHYRAELWRAGVHMAEDRPVLGWGPDTYYGNYTRYRSALDARTRGLVIPDAPRNVYVQWTASAGFVGLLAFLLLVACVVWLVASRAAALPRHLRLLAAAMGAGLVAYLVQAMFSVDAPPLALSAWVTIGGTIALLEARRSPRPPSPASPLRAAIACALVLAAAVGAFAGFGPLRADHAAWASDRFGAGWSEDAARLHAKAIRLNRREASYRSLAGAYFVRVAGADGTPVGARPAILAAAALYKAAAGLQPRNLYYTLDVARAYATLARRRHPEYFANADEWLGRAVALDPLDPQVHALRAAVLSQWAAKTGSRALAQRAQAELRTARSLANGA